jgi:hypothetical protein
MEEPNVGFGTDDHLTIELQNQSQRGVGGRVLWAEVQGPKAFAIAGIQIRRINQLEWHLI